MILVDNILLASASLVHGLLGLAWWVLVARIVLSWIQPRPTNDLVRSAVSAVYSLTEPVLWRLRAAFPFLRVGMLDLSPLVLFLAIGFLDQVVPRTLVQLAVA
ncbi:MAG: YggT family protein [Myxococcales bacterium]|nr:YggT family protein [Myxococcales bacterium]MCB9694121.1 YggT family protein [Alphaproteobacteria bacterium]